MAANFQWVEIFLFHREGCNPNPARRLGDDFTLMQRRCLFLAGVSARHIPVSVTEILHQIEALPTKDRWQVLEHTRHLLEPEIPESFTQGMAEIQKRDVIELDQALKELDSPK
jgi:hypothetical protein